MRNSQTMTGCISRRLRRHLTARSQENCQKCCRCKSIISHLHLSLRFLHHPFFHSSSLLCRSGPPLKKNKSRIFYGLHQVWTHPYVSLALYLRCLMTRLISVHSYKSPFLVKDFPSVVVVGLGKSDTGVCGKENWDNCKENIRAAVSGKCHCCVQVNLKKTREHVE